MLPGAQLAANESFGPEEILIAAGAGAALIAFVGLLLVIPLYVTQRREVQRLLRWKEQEPERGDGAAASTGDYPVGSGWRSPAERVTADRPALSRITAERAAIESPSFWRRLVARGPRHPLVISAAALLVAVAAVAAVSILGTPGDDEGSRRANLDRSAVDLVVLNASSEPELASKLAESLNAAGFTEDRTGATAAADRTVVMFDQRQRKAAGAVARELGIDEIEPLDRRTRATVETADVVVVAGEDQVRN